MKPLSIGNIKQESFRGRVLASGCGGACGVLAWGVPYAFEANAWFSLFGLVFAFGVMIISASFAYAPSSATRPFVASSMEMDHVENDSRVLVSVSRSRWRLQFYWIFVLGLVPSALVFYQIVANPRVSVSWPVALPVVIWLFVRSDRAGLAYGMYLGLGNCIIALSKFLLPTRGASLPIVLVVGFCFVGALACVAMFLHFQSLGQILETESSQVRYDLRVRPVKRRIQTVVRQSLFVALVVGVLLAFIGPLSFHWPRPNLSAQPPAAGRGTGAGGAGGSGGEGQESGGAGGSGGEEQEFAEAGGSGGEGQEFGGAGGSGGEGQESGGAGGSGGTKESQEGRSSVDSSKAKARAPANPKETANPKEAVKPEETPNPKDKSAKFPWERLAVVVVSLIVLVLGFLWMKRKRVLFFSERSSRSSRLVSRIEKLLHSGQIHRIDLLDLYLLWEKDLADLGFGRMGSETPLEYCARLAEVLPRSSQTISYLATALVQNRYGHKSVLPADLQKLRKAVVALYRDMRKWKSKL